MSTGFSFEEFCRIKLKDWLLVKEEEEEKPTAWYFDFVPAPGGGEVWGEHQAGLERYNKLTAFQRLIFDQLDYKFQMIAKKGSEKEWLEFVEETLNVKRS